MPKVNNTCARILTPKQVGPFCWFMATFVAMFYSQRSRKLLLESSQSWEVKKGFFPIFWNNRKKLFTLLKHVLDDKYLKTENRESKDYKNYKNFSDNTFHKILTLLNKVDAKTFPYIPNYITGGFEVEYYIGKLYKLLNIDYLIYDYSPSDDLLFYSFLNEEFNSVSYRIEEKKEERNVLIDIDADRSFRYIEENIIPPSILMVIVRDEEYKDEDEESYTTFYSLLFPNNRIKEDETRDLKSINELKSMKEKIFFKGVEYNLDAVLLANWNNLEQGHAIAGITCKKNKYVYNGWTRTSIDPVMAKKGITRKIPCELMRYDWNVKKDGDFCLNTDQCIPDVLKNAKELRKTELCFNFSKGQRTLIYVRKDANHNTSVESNKTMIVGGKIRKKPIVKPPENKVLNPKTGRYILIRNKK